jgi:hypothetical protein
MNQFIADTLGLTKLPAHLFTFGISFIGFTLVHLVLAPLGSKKWFPVAYGSNLESARARNNWWVCQYVITMTWC